MHRWSTLWGNQIGSLAGLVQPGEGISFQISGIEDGHGPVADPGHFCFCSLAGAIPLAIVNAFCQWRFAAAMQLWPQHVC